MKQGIFKPNLGRRGSAIIMALVIMTVLFLLGIAVITVSMGTLRTNVADAENTDAFYAAEAAVKSGIDQLKYEVAYYYNQMLTATSADYPTLYSNFFNKINENAGVNFKQLNFTGITTDTKFSIGTYDTANDICEFTITSTAIVDNTETEYKVVGRLYVEKIDVRASDPWEIDDYALLAGGTFTNSDGFAINGGDAYVGQFINPRGTEWYQGYNGNPVVAMPGIGDTINGTVSFSGVSYSSPSITSPDYYVTVNNSTLKSSAVDTAKAVTIASAPGVSFTLSDAGSLIYPGSVVYSRGNLNLSARANSPGITVYCDGNFTSSGGSKYVTVYCAGNVTISEGPFYGTIYCKGTVTISGNVTATVYCDGNFTMPSGSFKGLVVCGGNSNVTASGGIDASFYAAGDVSITSGLSGSNHVIYAGRDLTLSGGGGTNAVLFAGRDVYLKNGPTVNGAIIAKRNIYQSGWFTINYSYSRIQEIMEDPNNSFFFGGGGSSAANLDEAIVGSKITAIGRQ